MVPDTPQHRFALLDDTGKAICIDQISRSFGQSHKFFCPHCKSEMYATYGENKQVPHFRHNGVSCEYNNYLHTLAEFIFIEEYEKCLREGFPFNFSYHIPVKCVAGCIRNREFCGKNTVIKTIDLTQYFTKISRETRVDVGESYRRPDILLESEDGRQLWIEIWVKHQTEEEKRKDGTILELRINSESNIDELKKHSLTQSEGEGTSVRLFGNIISLEEPECERYELFEHTRNPSTSHMLYHSRPKHPHISSQIYSSFEELRWVDLGLPSGTLWAENDIGMMNYIAAFNRYGENLPSKENIQELESFCVAEWDQEKQRMVFTGRNGNQIYFYCKDKCNSWWGRNIVGSDHDKTFAERLHIDPPFVLYFNNLDVEKASKVRLIKLINH